MRKIIGQLRAFFSSTKDSEQNDLREIDDSRMKGNISVLNNLRSHGDDLSKSRDVFHWIYFKSETDRKNFITKVMAEGFTVINTATIEDIYPYQLQIKRFDKVDLQTVNTFVDYLAKLAEELKGNYDGWETSIEK